MRFLGIGPLVAGCALVMGCSAPAATPTPDSPTPVASAAPTAAAPTVSAAPATASVASDAPTAAATASAAAPAGATTLVLDGSASHASYHAHEQLVGRNLPSEAVGTSTAISGTVVLHADGSIDSAHSQVNVDLSQLASDESRRDNFIKGNTLQTSRFPTATFTPRDASGLPAPLPQSGEATFQLLGDLTVHGVTRPVTWQVTAQFNPASVTGNATTDVNISDFGMTPPKAGPVLSIQDGLTLELAFSAVRQA